MKKIDLGVYGFRIAEPNHDGTPHWHLLLFCGDVPGRAGRRALPRVAAIFRRYALADSPDEPGARLHRCKPVVIDWSRGSAAGYVAKYVAKNIDGMHVEKDRRACGARSAEGVRSQGRAAMIARLVMYVRYRRAGVPPRAAFFRVQRNGGMYAG